MGPRPITSCCRRRRTWWVLGLQPQQRPWSTWGDMQLQGGQRPLHAAGQLLLGLGPSCICGCALQQPLQQLLSQLL